MNATFILSLNWKNDIKQNDINNDSFTIAEHHFIRSSRVRRIQKVTSKELHYFLKATVEHKPNS